jgi:hypothetical protein
VRMNAILLEKDKWQRRKPKFQPICVHEETFEELKRMKGPGKTWDRFIRECIALPSEATA